MADWEYTKLAQDEAASSGHLQTNENFPFGTIVCEDGVARPLLGRDYVEMGGVFLTDSTETIGIFDSPFMEARYNEMKSSLQISQRRSKKSFFSRENKSKDEITEEQVLKTLFNYVKENIKYDVVRVESEMNPTKQKNYPLFPVEIIEKNKFGVCRHQTAVAAYYALKFIEEGYLKGQISCDRNILTLFDGTQGGHQWLRYTNNEKQVYILDTAQKVFDSLDNIDFRRINGHENFILWDYFRPDDIQNNHTETREIPVSEYLSIHDISPYRQSGEKITIGRLPSSNIKYQYEGFEHVSRHHASIEFDQNGTARVFDNGHFDEKTKKYVGSKNGTLVGDKKGKFTRISPGKSILIQEYGTIIIGHLIINIDLERGTLSTVYSKNSQGFNEVIP